MEPARSLSFRPTARTRSFASARFGWRWALVLAVLLLIAAPRFWPSASAHLFFALDSVTEERNASSQPLETAGQNFPGSAFFFAEGAFSPIGRPDIRSAPSAVPHVLQLSRTTEAPPFAMAGLSALDRYRALACLTSAIYYEAANEPDEGQRAVAQVILNRVRHPAWPNSVCGVVYQGSERVDQRCQFTFSCDGSVMRFPMGAKWARAQRVAADALAGRRFAPVGLATFYHTLAVHPAWANQLDPVAVVGAHIFYAMRGADGREARFTDTYAGREPAPGPAPRVATALQTPFPATNDTVLPQNPAMVSLPPAPQTSPEETGLPESTIRAEYRNTGRPLF
ncbi:cell wall hydrolase [Sphingobium subterraneum]|uniref:Cell wall hydrolase SleB domain-containing protein n=1 Tax=Sphingobium subterraneum TaxID=627688 RepID=A0A841J4U7_9SPHN|nr:cell wall hydrolase [Sphingobium subterraneum]MBB6123595.1 hypothetical protein [Sphingobium subterraneum]